LAYEDEDEGGCCAEVAGLSGCYTSGDTLDELLENVPDATAAFMESLKAKGESPPPVASFKLEIAVA
jgi:predicted RNase H-like HicB family nuclease